MNKISEITHFALETVSKHMGSNDSPVTGVALFALSISAAFLLRGSSQSARQEGKILSLSPDSLVHCMSFLETSDLAKLRLVSKIWKDVIDKSAGGQWLWKELSIREGVPIVEGSNRNHKDDFRLLRPITISGRIIGRHLGEVVGKVPLMREDRFLQLRDSQDSFEPTKFQRETHVVLIDPPALKITGYSMTSAP